MLIHPEQPACVLVEQFDLTTEAVHPLLAGVEDKLLSVLRWAREYLCRPHPELGRKGPVCPFAQASLDRGMFYLAVHRGETVEPGALDELLMTYRDWFRQLPPTTGPAAQFKTILLTLPDVPQAEANAIVDATQERLKPQYVAEGLMIGEFHSGPPDKAGLWNLDFRPLYSPVPLLAIRHMVSSDFPFLADDPGSVATYLRLFGANTPPALRSRVTAAANEFGLPAPHPAPVIPRPPVPQLADQQGAAAS
ncbi:DUF6875 domain-containing protein [Micromonospora sp. NBC_01796]|uniref:DUF6875 domain-containing protein n=1 Tax=Micromonospora sp. NBC_01796 TaxID=2975987 RepID=UPI002DD7ADD1|nr:hypothetical protein [Micromonospora sp. NBC_01796]WSA83613.1 hypothetical protein OIE47_24885 [Micromonospora sp. NBC_01796]